MHPTVIRIINTLAGLPISRTERTALRAAVRDAATIGPGRRRARCEHDKSQLRTRRCVKRGKAYEYEVCLHCDKAIRELRAIRQEATR